MPIPRAPNLDEAPRSTAWLVLRSLRPEQWSKNLILFGGLLFGMRLMDLGAVLRAGSAFVIFCALSGVVYLLNDVMDRDADQRHPLKCRRPIASGALLPSIAVSTAALLGAAGLGSAWLLGPSFFIVAASYVGLQILYSGPLRHVVILDVLTIAFGFVLRAVAGAIVIDVPISHWLLLDTVLLALFLALSKRRHELTLLAENATSHRRILEEYSPYLLDQMIAVVTASTLMGYALYTVSPDTVAKFGTDRLALTVPFPLYGIFRYLYLVHQKEGGGSPSTMLLTDKPLLICVALWACAVVLIIYRPFLS
jgi:4-hydroxybenzoate polyprenyltransferase